MSTPEQPSGGSRPSKGTNSVGSSNAESDGSGEIPAVVGERVREFRDRYPDLAGKPLSETHGRSLRRAVTEADWTEEIVSTDVFGESAFTTRSLDRRGASSWAEAIASFLTAHLRYDGLVARFSDGSDEFELPLTDAWTTEYQKKQYARAQSLDRVMAGGPRPSGGRSEPAWESPATAMITLSGTSIPDGERIGPVDHLDALHDSWSYDGVRNTLRNVMEYHLNLDSSEWGVWLQAEPHGVDGDGGLNACYTHLHAAVYYDSRGLDPQRVGSTLTKVIDKHLDVCEIAGWDAHNYELIDDFTDSDGVISVNEDVADLGCYMAAYNAGSFEEELEERPIEYLAWGALYWATARQRTTRSQTLNHAIEADACNQRAEQPEEIAHQEEEHGESVRWRSAHGPDVVCTHCGSGWAIDQNRVEEPDPVELPDASPTPDGGERSIRQRWPTATAAASYEEPLIDANLRERVEAFIEIHGTEVPIPRLLAQLRISPSRRDAVESIVEDTRGVTTDSFDRPVETGWELVAIVEDDGTEHTPGGGGVDMVDLHLPVGELLNRTRLRHDLRTGEKWRCGSCDFATHQSESMAHHLVDHGFDDASTADRMLIVEDYHDHDRDCMAPPDGHVSDHPAERKPAAEYDHENA